MKDSSECCYFRWGVMCMCIQFNKPIGSYIADGAPRRPYAWGGLFSLIMTSRKYEMGKTVPNSLKINNFSEMVIINVYMVQMFIIFRQERNSQLFNQITTRSFAIVTCCGQGHKCLSGQSLKQCEMIAIASALKWKYTDR